MKKTQWTLSALILLAFFGGFYFGRAGLETVHAQDMQEYFIRPSWGSLRGSIGNRHLLFEAEDGTVRVVDMVGSDPIDKTMRVDRIIRRR
jgi:hypothetical protein